MLLVGPRVGWKEKRHSHPSFTLGKGLGFELQCIPRTRPRPPPAEGTLVSETKRTTVDQPAAFRRSIMLQK